MKGVRVEKHFSMSGDRRYECKECDWLELESGPYGVTESAFQRLEKHVRETGHVGRCWYESASGCELVRVEHD